MQVRKDFQDKFEALCRSNGLPTSPGAARVEVSRAQKYTVKRMHTTINDDSRAWEPATAGMADVEDDAPKTMYGVTISKDKDKDNKDPSSPARNTGRWDNVPISIVAEAEKAWKMLRVASDAAYGSMKRAFRAVDSDGSGRIEMSELRHLISVHLNIDAEDELIEFIFHCLDRGDKGAITYTEFVEALAGPLVAEPGMTALEMQDHPLVKTFGKRQATQRPPDMHATDWDTTVTKAAIAGDRLFTVGASEYQYGDRHAWKSMSMYQTSTQLQNAAVRDIFGTNATSSASIDPKGAAGVVNKKDPDGNILTHDFAPTPREETEAMIRQSSAPTIAAYARQVRSCSLSPTTPLHLSPTSLPLPLLPSSLCPPSLPPTVPSSHLNNHHHTLPLPRILLFFSSPAPFIPSSLPPASLPVTVFPLRTIVIHRSRACVLGILSDDSSVLRGAGGRVVRGRGGKPQPDILLTGDGISILA